MGWVREDHPGHEGFPVALVERDGVSPGSLLYRELGYPQDDQPRDDVQVVQAGCECGWRSSYLRVRNVRGPSTPLGTVERPAWAPFTVIMDERDEDRLCELWNGHLRGGALENPVDALVKQLPEANRALAKLTEAIRKLDNRVYLIWSNEHRGWWAPHERGYVARIEEAGRYTRESAREICVRAMPGRRGAEPLREIPVPLEDVTVILQRFAESFPGFDPEPPAKWA
jgi:hypothetical protein